MAIASTTRTPNGFLVFCGTLFALLLIATIFVASIAAGPRPSDLDKKRADARIAVREKLEKEAADALTTEGWVDKAAGTVRVPVASVFNLTAAELRGKKPTRSTVKVDAPIPPAPIDPASTEPPPPAMTSAPQGADNVRFPLPETATPAPAATVPPAPAPAAPAPVPPAATAPPAPAPVAPVPAATQPAPPAAVPAEPARPPLINRPPSQ